MTSHLRLVPQSDPPGRRLYVEAIYAAMLVSSGPEDLLDEASFVASELVGRTPARARAVVRRIQAARQDEALPPDLAFWLIWKIADAKYECDSETDAKTDRLKAAMREFERSHGLPVSGWYSEDAPPELQALQEAVSARECEMRHRYFEEFGEEEMAEMMESEEGFDECMEILDRAEELRDDVKHSDDEALRRLNRLGAIDVHTVKPLYDGLDGARAFLEESEVSLLMDYLTATTSPEDSARMAERLATEAPFQAARDAIVTAGVWFRSDGLAKGLSGRNMEVLAEPMPEDEKAGWALFRRWVSGIDAERAARLPVELPVADEPEEEPRRWKPARTRRAR